MLLQVPSALNGLGLKTALKLGVLHLYKGDPRGTTAANLETPELRTLPLDSYMRAHSALNLAR